MIQLAGEQRIVVEMGRIYRIPISALQGDPDWSALLAVKRPLPLRIEQFDQAPNARIARAIHRPGQAVAG